MAIIERAKPELPNPEDYGWEIKGEGYEKQLWQTNCQLQNIL